MPSGYDSVTGGSHGSILGAYAEGRVQLAYGGSTTQQLVKRLQFRREGLLGFANAGRSWTKVELVGRGL